MRPKESLPRATQSLPFPDPAQLTFLLEHKLHEEEDTAVGMLLCDLVFIPPQQSQEG